jgi:dienelactone hydrolase
MCNIAAGAIEEARMGRAARRGWLAVLLFGAGLASGMVTARFRLPPYSQLDWLHDRYLTSPAAFGPTPEELFRTDASRLIDLADMEAVRALRARLISFLWGGRGLPSRPADRIESGVRLAKYADLAHVGRVDRLVLAMDHGLVSMAFHLVPRRPNGRAVLYHHGHIQAAAPADLARIDRLLGEGYAVVELFMPLMGPNSRPMLDLPRIGRFRLTEHEHLDLLDPDQGDPIGYFVEPAVRVVNHLAPQYRRIAIMGYSGGGWTAMMTAAVDERVSAAFVVASVYPYFLSSGTLRDWSHYESGDPDLHARTATHLELLALAAAGPDRQAVQILNRYDPCCYAGRRSETYAPAVRQAVRRLGAGEFRAFVDESGRAHTISDRAMDLILARLRRQD